MCLTQMMHRLNREVQFNLFNPQKRSYEHQSILDRVHYLMNAVSKENSSIIWSIPLSSCSFRSFCQRLTRDVFSEHLSESYRDYQRGQVEQILDQEELESGVELKDVYEHIQNNPDDKMALLLAKAFILKKEPALAACSLFCTQNPEVMIQGFDYFARQYPEQPAFVVYYPLNEKRYSLLEAFIRKSAEKEPHLAYNLLLELPTSHLWRNYIDTRNSQNIAESDLSLLRLVRVWLVAHKII